jgi:hypothetical protein
MTYPGGIDVTWLATTATTTAFGLLRRPEFLFIVNLGHIIRIVFLLFSFALDCWTTV